MGGLPGKPKAKNKTGALYRGARIFTVGEVIAKVSWPAGPWVKPGHDNGRWNPLQTFMGSEVPCSTHKPARAPFLLLSRAALRQDMPRQPRRTLADRSSIRRASIRRRRQLPQHQPDER